MAIVEVDFLNADKIRVVATTPERDELILGLEDSVHITWLDLDYGVGVVLFQKGNEPIYRWRQVDTVSMPRDLAEKCLDHWRSAFEQREGRTIWRAIEAKDSDEAIDFLKLRKFIVKE